MNMYRRIETEIGGNPEQKEHRTELLRQLVDAFVKGGQEGLTSDLAAHMKELEEHFDTELAKLDAKL